MLREGQREYLMKSASTNKTTSRSLFSFFSFSLPPFFLLFLSSSLLLFLFSPPSLSKQYSGKQSQRDQSDPFGSAGEREAEHACGSGLQGEAGPPPQHPSLLCTTRSVHLTLPTFLYTRRTSLLGINGSQNVCLCLCAFVRV